MVTEYGMSDALGAVNYNGARDRPLFLDAAGGPERGPYAEDTAQLIDAEVRRLMTAAHEQARRILADRRDALEAVTARLLEKEVVDGDELRAML